jgi:hypothetical protein
LSQCWSIALDTRRPVGAVYEFSLATSYIMQDDDSMSNREIVIDLIQKLPENASLHDITREIEFIAGVREGFEQLERGEGVSAEKVREMIPSWIVNESVAARHSRLSLLLYLFSTHHRLPVLDRHMIKFAAQGNVS